MMLDFYNDKTYAKTVVLENIRYALMSPEAVGSDVLYATMLDMLVVFVLVDTSNPNRPGYKILDKTDLISFGLSLNELMDAANENCKKSGYRITTMEDMAFEVCGIKLKPSAFCPMFVGTNKESLLGASILMYEKYFEDLAVQIEDDLCIAPSSIHEVFIFPLSLVNPKHVIEIVREVNREIVEPHEKLSDSIYIYRRDTHGLSQCTIQEASKYTC